MSVQSCCHKLTFLIHHRTLVYLAFAINDPPSPTLSPPLVASSPPSRPSDHTRRLSQPLSLEPTLTLSSQPHSAAPLSSTTDPTIPASWWTFNKAHIQRPFHGLHAAWDERLKAEEQLKAEWNDATLTRGHQGHQESTGNHNNNRQGRFEGARRLRNRSASMDSYALAMDRRSSRRLRDHLKHPRSSKRRSAAPSPVPPQSRSTFSGLRGSSQPTTPQPIEREGVAFSEYFAHSPTHLSPPRTPRQQGSLNGSPSSPHVSQPPQAHHPHPTLSSDYASAFTRPKFPALSPPTPDVWGRAFDSNDLSRSSSTHSDRVRRQVDGLMSGGNVESIQFDYGTSERDRQHTMMTTTTSAEYTHDKQVPDTTTLRPRRHSLSDKRRRFSSTDTPWSHLRRTFVENGPGGTLRQRLRRFLIFDVRSTLALRMLGCACCLVALAMAVENYKYEHSTNMSSSENDTLVGVIGPSVVLTIGYASITVVHQLVTMWREAFGRPIGLWGLRSKMVWVCGDLLFIALW